MQVEDMYKSMFGKEWKNVMERRKKETAEKKQHE